MAKKKKNRGIKLPGKKAQKPVSKKLEKWQQRLADSDSGFSDERGKMDRRERLYNGDNTLEPLVPGDTGEKGKPLKTSHVRNIVFENIESQISSEIPNPKVTPKRQKDEKLAAKIEHFLRNELDRLPFERINDMAERTCVIQGGVGFLVEWDNTRRTHDTVGMVDVCTVHPKQFGPQPGVYTGVDDMDWFIVKVPTTKETVRRKYGIDVMAEGESEPQIRGTGSEDISDDAVTMYVGFELAEGGGINKYVWCNDVELEDLENYQARRQPVCTKCGRVRPLVGQVIAAKKSAGNLLPDPAAGLPGALAQEQLEKMAAGQAFAMEMALAAAEGTGEETLLPGVSTKQPPVETYDGGACPWCGSEDFNTQEMEFEEVFFPFVTGSGLQVPGAAPGLDDDGKPALIPTKIPFYKPDVYPFVLQVSVSVYGQLLGNSDVDAIATQQNTLNRIEQKIIERIMKAGSRVTLPSNTKIQIDPKDQEVWRLDDPAAKAMIDTYDFTGNLQYEMAFAAQVYEEARQIIGVTDSFQGRRDPTATSGKAKEYAAAQAAGRMESKRIMKNAAYAEIFERMFKFALAYSDEPRVVSFKNYKGDTEYEEFSRYDFLERDEDGTYWWNDQFIFSCDTTASLASNREAMWQETRMNLQQGAFGDPMDIQTLILFWQKMEELHYPGAGTTKKFLEDKLEGQRQAAIQQTNDPAGAGVPGQVPGAVPGVGLGGNVTPVV